jgi:hypothetical protein
MFSIAALRHVAHQSNRISFLEVFMFKLNRQFLATALPLAAAFAFAATSGTLAAKKLSYEQAWAQCKKEIGANVPGSDTITSTARSAAGGACMKRYGYRLKKGS